MAEGKGAGFWAAMGAVGGLLGGAASAIGLFMAKPDTITVFVPTQTLREVVVTAEKAQGIVQPPETTAPPVAAAAAPPPPAPSRPLGGDLIVALANAVETPDRFVISLRFTNDSDTEKRVGIRGTNSFEGDMTLTSADGATCPWQRTSTQPVSDLGSLRAILPHTASDADRQAPVPPHSSIMQTAIFTKANCTPAGGGAGPLTLNSNIVIVEGTERRTTAASFENIARAP